MIVHTAPKGTGPEEAGWKEIGYAGIALHYLVHEDGTSSEWRNGAWHHNPQPPEDLPACSND